MTISGVSPAVIAAAVGEARAFLRLEGGAEQALLERLAATAILLGEAFTGTVFVARTVEEVVPAAAGSWQLLSAMPVSAIVGVSELSAEAYAVDVDGEGRGWVRVIAPRDAVRVAVSYTAGLAASWAEVPAPAAQGVVMLIAHLFDDRDGAKQPPAAVAALWRPYRRMRLAVEARA